MADIQAKKIHERTHGHVYRNRGFAYDDCYFYISGSDAYEGGIRIKNNGSGTGVTDDGAAETTTGHFGVLKCDTGSTASGRAGLGSDTQDVIYLGASVINFGSIVKVPTLSVGGGNDFWVGTGIADAVGSTTPYGVFFEYQTGGGNIRGVCRNAGGVSYTSSTFTVDTSWHCFQFTITNTSSVAFYVDGTQLGSNVTSNIPTEILGFLPINIIKTNSTASRTAKIDAYWYEWTYNSSR